MNFSSKEAVRLNTSFGNTIEKCKEFYKRMCMTHNRFQASVETHIQEFPSKEKHLKNLQDKLQAYEQNIQNIEGITEEEIKTWVAQASVHKYIL